MPKHRLTNVTRLPMKERRRRKCKKERYNRKAHGRHHRVPRQKVSTEHLRTAGRPLAKEKCVEHILENSRNGLSLHIAEKSCEFNGSMQHHLTQRFHRRW